MKRRRRIGSANGESPLLELPEEIIYRIQSYMSGKEAARTTILSKSWHTAWLTRPSLDFDSLDFKYSFENFEEYATGAMRRYRKSGVKIESFRLSSQSLCNKNLCRNLIVKAIKIGATDLQIEMPHTFTLPKQVLRSRNLLRLSLTWCRVANKSFVNISFPSLKSLTLKYFKFTSSRDALYDILTSCNASIEELSLFASRLNDLHEFHKLRRLFLFSVEAVAPMFSNDFASRFPCLNELSIQFCSGCDILRIASTSLQTISFEPLKGVAWSAEFDVPNIRKFTYSGWCLPSSSKLSIKAAAASREWEFDVSIYFSELQDSKWFLKLKRYLKKYVKKYRLLRISLRVILADWDYTKHHTHEHEIKTEVAPKPLVMDNLIIDGPSTYLCALLLRLFGICRPKFITRDSSNYSDGPCIYINCRRLITMGAFGLKKVKMERSPPMVTNASALGKKQKTVCELIWNE